MKSFIQFMSEQQSDDEEETMTGGDASQDTEGEDDPGQEDAYQTPNEDRKVDKQGGTYVPPTKPAASSGGY